MKILTLGDVFGEEAAAYVANNLAALRRQNGIEFVVCNAENGSGANGVEADVGETLLAAGCDVLTGGNHTLSRPSFRALLSDRDNVLRPANYPPPAPGSGYTVAACAGRRILVANLRGNGGFDPAVDCPFDTLARILAHEKGNYDFAVVDVHAEFTSEKLALLHAFDGAVSVMVGTHTHVPTADLRITEKGTGYITDLGMCGPKNSILGVECDIIVSRLRDKSTERFRTAKGAISAMGAIFEINDAGRCVWAQRIAF